MFFFLTYIFLFPLLYETSIADYLLVVFIAFMFFYICINKMIVLLWKRNKIIIISFIFAIIFMIIMILFSGDFFSSTIRVIQYFGCFCSFIIGTQVRLTSKSRKVTLACLYFFVAVSVFHWLLTGSVMDGYSFIYSNSNTFASILIYIFGFLFVLYKKSMLNIIVALFIIFLCYASSSRAAFGSIIIMIVIHFIFNIIYNKKGRIQFLTRLLLYITIILLAVFIFIYPSLISTELGMRLQDFSIEKFGKNLFSGRNIIWGKLLEAIKLKPIFGYGLDATPDVIYSVGASSHNLYLQTALQVGIVGFVILIFPLFLISRKLTNINNSKIIGFFSFLIAILFHECFEITLTQNMLISGLAIWFIFGIGYGMVMKKKMLKVQHFVKEGDIND